jgi:hypothetical protein
LAPDTGFEGVGDREFDRPHAFAWDEAVDSLKLAASLAICL